MESRQGLGFIPQATPHALQPLNFQTETLDDLWDDLIQHINDSQTANIPRTSYKKIQGPVLSIRTQTLLAQLNSRYTTGPQHHNITSLRRQILLELQKDRHSQWKQILKDNDADRRTNPQRFWRKIKNLLGKKVPLPITLKFNNNTYESTQEILTAFKEHWQNIFIPHPTSRRSQPHHDNIIRWTRDNQNLLTHDRQLTPALMNSLDHSEPLKTPFIEEEVKHHIKKLRNKTPGPTNITSTLIKHLPNTVINYLTYLYNASFVTGYIPTSFKTAHLILIPKPGKNPQLPGSYRPIALLEIFGKILEKMINSRLRMHLESNDLLPEHGFRAKRNTQTPTILAIDTIQNARSRGLKSIIITKDIEKAFDITHNT